MPNDPETPNARTDDVLASWDAVAAAVTLPDRAPQPRPGTAALGLAIAAAAGVLAVAVAGRALQPPGPAANGPSSTPNATTGAVASPAGQPASSLPTAPAVAVPSCRLDQLELGEPTSSYGFGALGTTVVFVTLGVVNTGAACRLDVPGRVAVAGAGESATIDVVNAGAGPTYTLGADAAASIVLGASWRNPGEAGGESTPCPGVLFDVSRVEVPIGSSSVAIDLIPLWRQVCPAPTSVSVAIQ